MIPVLSFVTIFLVAICIAEIDLARVQHKYRYSARTKISQSGDSNG